MEPPLCGPACPRHGKLPISRGVRVPCACTEAAPLSLPPARCLYLHWLCIGSPAEPKTSSPAALRTRIAIAPRQGEGEGETSEQARECEIRLQLSPNTACACGFTMFASLECTRLWRCCCCSWVSNSDRPDLGNGCSRRSSLWTLRKSRAFPNPINSNQNQSVLCARDLHNGTKAKPGQARKGQEEGVAHPRLCLTYYIQPNDKPSIVFSGIDSAFSRTPCRSIDLPRTDFSFRFGSIELIDQACNTSLFDGPEPPLKI